MVCMCILAYVGDVNISCSLRKKLHFLKIYDKLTSMNHFLFAEPKLIIVELFVLLTRDVICRLV